ncbi:hypothetical protein AAZX31_12G192700 [Glycine max]
MKKYKGERNIEQIWKNPMSLSLAVVLQASGDGGSRDSRGHTRERRWWFNVWRRRVVTKRKRRKRGKKKKSMRKMKVSDFFVLERKIKLERWEGEGRLWSWMGKWGKGEGSGEKKKRGGEVGKATWGRRKVLE